MVTDIFKVSYYNLLGWPDYFCHMVSNFSRALGIFRNYPPNWGVVAQLVEALSYKPEGHGFNS
jgi:hypothetical protein